MFILPKDQYRIRTTARKGRAVFAKKDIAPGTPIGDYLGKIMRFGEENEMRDGLYTMWINSKFDILADRKAIGMHTLNHSCANNCDVFPYQGHMIVFANRHIFKGEELTIHYSLTGCDESKVPCALHQCYCGTEMCVGTMHVRERKGLDPWEEFVIKRQGKYFKKLIGPYGSQVQPLARYPKSVGQYAIYNVSGEEHHTPIAYRDRSLPKTAEIHRRIRETGRRLRFPALHFTVWGIRDGIIMGQRS